MNDLVLFALGSTQELGHKVGAILKIPVSPLEQRFFEDGEHKIRPMVNVRNKDVYVIHSLYDDETKSVNDKLCELLFFIGALKDASAIKVTAVLPYLCYARKDQKTKPRDPVTTRYLAALFEAVGADRVVTIDVHNLAAFQNAFRCATDHLEAKTLFVKYLASLIGNRTPVVGSPDIGGMKRADAFRKALSAAIHRPIEMAFMEKKRSEGVVSGEIFVGEVNDRVVVIIDDLISTGGTISRMAKICRQKGCHQIYAVATHGAFFGDARSVLSEAPIDEIIVTDSIPICRLKNSAASEKLTVLETAPLLAEAIKRIHLGGSVVELLEG